MLLKNVMDASRNLIFFFLVLTVYLYDCSVIRCIWTMPWENGSVIISPRRKSGDILILAWFFRRRLRRRRRRRRDSRRITFILKNIWHVTSTNSEVVRK